MPEELVYIEEKLEEINKSGRLKYRSKSLPTWCPGCGYFSMTEGVADGLNEMKISLDETVIVSGIGCASRFPFFMDTYGFHTLHGRVLPVATGIKMANEDLTVVAVGGDGDGFAIGGGHVSHAARRNVDITYLLFDNAVYGLTKGQASPTSALNFKTGSTPYKNHDKPLNPLMMLLAYEASWVGQAYAGHAEHLKEMIKLAIAHRGFSYLHIQSPCVTFDKTDRTYENLDMGVRYLPEDHDYSDLHAAMKEADNSAALNPALGILYKEDRPTLGDNMNSLIKAAQG